MQKSKAKILIIDDDETSISLLTDQVKKAGHEVVKVTATASEALSFLNSNPCDLSLVDIYLKENYSGIELAKSIDQIHSIPTIFVTEVDEEEIIKSAIKSRPYGYLTKPINLSDLISAIEIALYRGKLEKDLRERQHRLDLILESNPYSVIQVNDAGVLEYANQSAQKLFNNHSGAFSEELLTNLAEFRLVEGGNPITIDTLLDLSKNRSAKFFLNTKNGLDYMVKVSSRLLQTEPYSHILNIEDITEREINLKRFSLLENALENLVEGVLVTEYNPKTSEHSVYYANDKAQKIIGQRIDLNLKNRLKDLIDEKAFNQISGLIESNLPLKKPCNFEIFMKQVKRSQSLLEWNLTYIELEGYNFPMIIHVFRDITHLRLLERNLAQSQKLEALGQLASGIAHDFNNIVAIISGLSEVLMIKAKDNLAIKESARKIFETSQRGNQIVSELMLFSRSESSSEEHSVLQESFELIVPLLRHLLPSSIKISCSCNHDKVTVPLSRTKLEQIFFNLATNASDAMGERSGKFSITSNIEEIAEENGLKVNPALSQGTYVAITVVDDGKGIPQDVLEHIFEPFYTTKPEGKGTGLGLSTIYGICKHAKGGIAVKSVENEGTSFILYVPVIK